MDFDLNLIFIYQIQIQIEDTQNCCSILSYKLLLYLTRNLIVGTSLVKLYWVGDCCQIMIYLSITKVNEITVS